MSKDWLRKHLSPFKERRRNSRREISLSDVQRQAVVGENQRGNCNHVTGPRPSAAEYLSEQTVVGQQTTARQP